MSPGSLFVSQHRVAAYVGEYARLAEAVLKEAEARAGTDAADYYELASHIRYLWGSESRQRCNAGLSLRDLAGFTEQLAELKAE